MSVATTIRIEKSLKSELDSLRASNSESYADIIRRLINSCSDEEPLSESEIVQIEESLKEIKAGKVIPWKKAKKELGV